MTTALQIQANRRNAQLSRGPRTERGRRLSSLNALRHGLTSRQVIVFDESSEAFEHFYREIANALRPEGAMEIQLTERVAINAWRLRRVYRVESGLFERRRTAWIAGKPETTNGIDLVFLRLTSAKTDELTKLSRYEACIERLFRRALHDLERRQNSRFKTVADQPKDGSA